MCQFSKVSFQNGHDAYYFQLSTSKAIKIDVTFCSGNCQEAINKHKIIQDQEKVLCQQLMLLFLILFVCLCSFLQCILFSACLWGLPRYSATFLLMTHVHMLPHFAIFKWEHLKRCWCLPGASCTNNFPLVKIIFTVILLLRRHLSAGSGWEHRFSSSDL